MVNLRVLREVEPVLLEQAASGVEIRRACASESGVIADWVREKINPNWGIACEVALEQTPPDCFIACEINPNAETTAVSSENLLGFACYDVVTKGVYGPSAVREDLPNEAVGTALMLACLHAMAAQNYPHAVIGWAGTTDGYSGRS